ncbi:MAG: CcdB family protein [Maricaulaceae bacterium]|nr:CcdB family protein [Maricaulaceae bacterium]
MARFDVRRLAGATAPLVVEVQADVLDELASRVVIPLRPVQTTTDEAMTRLKPRIRAAGGDYVLLTTDIAALPVRRLGEVIDNVEAAHRDDITAALDFLFAGF